MVQQISKQDESDIDLPDKKYFKIGETSSLLGVKPHVLRYWETEFPQIKPCKSKTGQRLYRRRDVEALARIQRLLHKERFTIAGARQALRLGNWTSEGAEGDLPPASALVEVEGPTLMPQAETETVKAEINPMVHLALFSAKRELESLMELVSP